MNEPPDHTAEFNAANLLSAAGTTEAKYSLNKSSFSRKALSVSLKIIPFSSNSFPYYDIQLLIHIVQKHQLNIFVLLLVYLIYQMYV